MTGRTQLMMSDDTLDSLCRAGVQPSRIAAMKKTRETELRANLAMRVEDHRIALKHCIEAAARPHSPENVLAYQRADAWAEMCAAREQEARGDLIKFSLGQSAGASC